MEAGKQCSFSLSFEIIFINKSFMKQIIKLSVIILSAGSLLFSCNGNQGETNVKDSSSSSTIESTENVNTNSTGDASYYYTIDGKNFSGSGTNQFVNAAVVHVPGIIYFNLAPVVPGTSTPGYGFNFEVADKGTTVVKGDEDHNYDITYTPENAGINTFKCKEMTVIITSSDGKRVAGTFSGTMIEPKTERVVSVTDGKFDIPYSTADKQ